MTFNGETLTLCLKIESSTSISFTAQGQGTLVLVFGGTTNAAGQKIKVDDVALVIPDSQILEVSLGAGAHKITKDNSINLFYVAYVPASTSHTHSYESAETKAPTCTEAGEKVYTCACGDSYTEATEPIGHSYELTETKASTCTETGENVYTCQNCSDSYAEKADALGHDYRSEITESPTCTEMGEMTYTCAHCQDSYTKLIFALGHSYTDGATRFSWL